MSMRMGCHGANRKVIPGKQWSDPQPPKTRRTTHSVRFTVPVAEVQAKVGSCLCTADLNRKLRPRPILAEKWIRGPEEYRFPPGHHVRKFCVQTRLAMEVEVAAVQAIFARQVHLGSWNLELQLGKLNDAVREIEHAAQIGTHVIKNVLLNLLHFSPAAHTEGVDFVLDVVVGEMRLGYLKLPRQP